MDGIEEIIFFDPLITTVRGILAYCKPNSSVCNGGAGFKSNEVDFRPPFNDRALGVVILEPEKT